MLFGKMWLSIMTQATGETANGTDDLLGASFRRDRNSIYSLYGKKLRWEGCLKAGYFYKRGIIIEVKGKTALWTGNIAHTNSGFSLNEAYTGQRLYKLAAFYARSHCVCSMLTAER